MITTPAPAPLAGDPLTLSVYFDYADDAAASVALYSTLFGAPHVARYSDTGPTYTWTYRHAVPRYLAQDADAPVYTLYVHVWEV